MLGAQSVNSVSFAVAEGYGCCSCRDPNNVSESEAFRVASRDTVQAFWNHIKTGCRSATDTVHARLSAILQQTGSAVSDLAVLLPILLSRNDGHLILKPMSSHILSAPLD